MINQKMKTEELVAYAERISQILASQEHSELKKIATTFDVWSKQIRELLLSNPDKKVLSSIRAGFKQGLQELPRRLAGKQGVDVDRLLRLISEDADLQVVGKAPTKNVITTS